MYAKIKAKTEKLKSYHHIKLDQEFKSDCLTWLSFLQNEEGDRIQKVMCRPWVDLTVCKEAPELDFFTDASGGKETGGCGGVLQNEWFKATWNPSFMEEKNPSIAYLELFALVSAVIIWKAKLANSRFTMFCDNQAVVEMVNNLTSGCQNCIFADSGQDKFVGELQDICQIHQD